MGDPKTVEMILKDTSPGGETKEYAIVKLPTLVHNPSEREIKVHQHKKAQIPLLCDVYVACVVKSFTNLKLAEGTFNVNYTFVSYVKPHPNLSARQRHWLATHMKLRCDDQAGEEMPDPIVGEWRHEGVDFIKFTVRQSKKILIPVKEQIKAVENFPFDRFELQLRFEFESVWIPSTDEEDPPEAKIHEDAVRVRFNVWHPTDIKNGFHRGSRSKEVVDRLPEYQIDFGNRRCWGQGLDKDNSQPVITYGVEVARVSLNMVWTTFFPMFATQALLVLLHTIETNISVGDIATIMLALFAFLTSARDKIPVFPEASVLDKVVFVFVVQLIFVCCDVLYEYFFPEHSGRDRPIFLLISTVAFGLQLGYVAYRWFTSGFTRARGPHEEKGRDTRTETFKPEEWTPAVAPKESKQ